MKTVKALMRKFGWVKLNRCRTCRVYCLGTWCSGKCYDVERRKEPGL